MRMGGGPPRSAKPVKINWATPASTPRRPASGNIRSVYEKRERSDEPPYGPEWAATRQVVLRRDNYTCRKCGVVRRPPKHGWLDAHHIKSRRKGGPDTPDNLITLCKTCHSLAHQHLLNSGYGQAKKRRR